MKPALLPLTIDTAELPPRIARMVEALYRHREVICAYHSLCLAFDCKGELVEPRLEKVPLNAKVDKQL